MTGRFERIYHEHLRSVFRFALSSVRRREIAEDIASDTFLALLRNLDGLDDTQIEGWLITVARNRARDYWRHNLTEQRYLESHEIPDSVPAADPAWSGLFENPGLKPIHRICLVLRFRDGMSRSEIALEVGLSEIQVKGHLQYALQLLRKALTGDDRVVYEDQGSGTI